MLAGDDDAGLYLFNRTSRCDVGNWTQKGANARGFNNRELIWAIDDCRIDPLGFNREVANPFRDFATFGAAGDVNPVLLAINRDPTSAGFGLPLEGAGADGIPNATALPYRPGTEFAALPGNKVDFAGGQKRWQSQGIFVPNLAVRKKMRNGDFDTFDQNFSLNELAVEPRREPAAAQGAAARSTSSSRRSRAGSGCASASRPSCGARRSCSGTRTSGTPSTSRLGSLASLEESRIALCAVRGDLVVLRRWARSRTCASSS